MKNNEKWTLDSYSVSEFYSIIKSEHYKFNQEERRSSGNPISYIHIWPYLKFKFSIIQFYSKNEILKKKLNTIAFSSVQMRTNPAYIQFRSKTSRKTINQ